MLAITPRFSTITNQIFVIPNSSSITVSNTGDTNILITNSKSENFLLTAGATLNLNINNLGFESISVDATGGSASIVYF